MRSTWILTLIMILTLIIVLGSRATVHADVTLYSLGDYMVSWSEKGPSSQAFGVGRYNVNQLGRSGTTAPGA